MNSISVVTFGLTALLCLSQICNIHAIESTPNTLKSGVRQKIVMFYNEMIPQLPEDSVLRQGFEVVRDLLTVPIARIDGDKVAKFVKILMVPGSVNGSLKSLSQDQKKKLVNFYDDVIPQMPKASLLRMRFEQSQEVLTQPDKFSAKDFTPSTEVKREILKFFNEMIPQIPKNNGVRQGFEILSDLQTQPDKVDGERMKQFLQFFLAPQKARENLRALTPEVRQKMLIFFNHIIPKIPEKSLFRLRFEQGKALIESFNKN